MEKKKNKILLIVNPCAGKNKSRASIVDIVERFSSENYEFTVKTTAGRGDATELVKNCIADNDMVVCCGGDGTLNETINGIMQLSRRVPIGYIPTGSTNDLANTIGIPTEVNQAVELILNGHTNTYDIGLFNNRFFSYVASFGPATKMSYTTPQKLKNLLGHSAYMVNTFVFHLISTLKEVKPVHIRFEYDGGVIDDIFYFAAISNSTSVAGIFKYDANDIKLNDGLFEVILVRNVRSVADTFHMFGKILRRAYDGESLLYFKTSSVRMTFDEPQDWTLDGEYGGAHKEVRLQVLPRALDICSPDDHPMFLKEELPLVMSRPAPDQEKHRLRKRKDKKEDPDAPAETDDETEPADEAEPLIQKLRKRREKKEDADAPETAAEPAADAEHAPESDEPPHLEVI
ncbi:MAG: diacylglycerol kinase family lipid kinase [Clostridia bacterium]|nr:diacylglycerol kinase family lipid kinase [Clostridia bacterium]